MSTFQLETGAIISPPVLQLVPDPEEHATLKDSNVFYFQEAPPNNSQDQKLNNYEDVTDQHGGVQSFGVTDQQGGVQSFVVTDQQGGIQSFGVADQQGGVQRFQTKYAAPDNLQLPNMNTQISIITIESSDVVKTNGSGSAFSDTSSDVSDITTSIPSANSCSSYVLPVVEGISEQDISQVDMFYRSHKTEVTVCRSLANLYVSTPKPKVKSPEVQISRTKSKSFKEKKSKSSEVPVAVHPAPSDFSKDEWSFTKTGIPALILDTGDHIREKSLKIVLAEKGTGFTLWQDQLNHVTEYNTPHSNFHTITISKDTTRLVGLSFDEGKAAVEFADAVRSLISDSVADSQTLSSKKKKKKEKPRHKYKPPKKVDISQPVCFVHVTKIQKPDLVASLFPPPPGGALMSRLGIPRALSDSSGISVCSTTLSEH